MTTDDWKISLLGTGALVSQAPRALPATLVDVGDYVYLFDCGDGTSKLLRALGKLDVDLVAITNLGTSELAGLITLAEINRRAKRKPLRVAGPPGVHSALEGLCAIATFSVAELFDIADVHYGTAFNVHGRESLECLPVDVAQGSACGYLLYESPRPGRVDAAKARELGIKGDDFARLLAGEVVNRVRPTDVIGPPRTGRRVVVTGRGRPTDELRVALQSSDVAIFAAPFTDERLEVAEESGYLTGWEAAQLASDTDVRLPVIQRLGTHSRTRYQLAEARQYNDRLVAPHDGQWIAVPLPERGHPRLHLDTVLAAPDKPARPARPPRRIRTGSTATNGKSTER